MKLKIRKRRAKRGLLSNWTSEIAPPMADYGAGTGTGGVGGGSRRRRTIKVAAVVALSLLCGTAVVALAYGSATSVGGSDAKLAALEERDASPDHAPRAVAEMQQALSGADQGEAASSAHTAVAGALDPVEQAIQDAGAALTSGEKAEYLGDARQAIQLEKWCASRQNQPATPLRVPLC